MLNIQGYYLVLVVISSGVTDGSDRVMYVAEVSSQASFVQSLYAASKPNCA